MRPVNGGTNRGISDRGYPGQKLGAVQSISTRNYETLCERKDRRYRSTKCGEEEWVCRSFFMDNLVKIN